MRTAWRLEDKPFLGILNNMENPLPYIRKTAANALANAHTLDELEKIRIEYLGRKGVLTEILRTLKDLSPDKRRVFGAAANELRTTLEGAIGERRVEIEKVSRESVLEREWIDVTRPGVREPHGHLHPLTKMLREMSAVFTSMGFQIVEGPEVETEYYNFDALNIPANHPARDMWDTFWLKDKWEQTTYDPVKITKKTERLLLRTHTSPVQVRYMEAHNPPIRIIVPGRVYRYETTDASHDYQFNQLEGLLVDKNVSIANFKALIQEFFSRLFKARVQIRLRPSYFPFTEPSFEVDISCVNCGGKGCPVCKKTGWLELAGAGMVHPHVFKAAGYNPKDVQGFAFGMGIDRLVMMKYKINDIRLMRAGDIRFLKQF